MKTVLIVNAHSRSGRRLFGEARRLLGEAGVTLEAAVAVRRPSTLRDVVAAEIADGAERIVLGGGDGTIGRVSDLLAKAGVVMAVLPLGTTNSFARSVALPLDLEGARRVVATGRTGRVDLGRIGGFYFANSAMVGLPADIGQSIPDWLKKIFGRLGYAIYALVKLPGFDGFDCTVTGESDEIRREVVEIRVAGD